MCLYPKLIKNPKYKANKTNGGVIPAITDIRAQMVPIGCKNCLECRKQKAREWKVRLTEDIKTNKNAKFIGLTFSNEALTELYMDIAEKYKVTPTDYELDNTLATLAVRRFLERYRKKYGKSLRHWLVTELGHQNTEHIHLHGIIWTNEKLETIEQIWNYGVLLKGKKLKENIYQNYVNERTVNYIVKYVTKIDEHHKYYNSIILTSPGIGHNYTSENNYNWKANKYNGINTNETYKTRQGTKLALPIYYRNKIYSEDEREKLWMQKLDKQERWILGQKIDISKSEKEYYQALQYAQKLNNKMGYRSPQINWNEKQYELERRILKQKERIPNIK